MRSISERERRKKLIYGSQASINRHSERMHKNIVRNHNENQSSYTSHCHNKIKREYGAIAAVADSNRHVDEKKHKYLW